MCKFNFNLTLLFELKSWDRGRENGRLEEVPFEWTLKNEFSLKEQEGNAEGE